MKKQKLPWDNRTQGAVAGNRPCKPGAAIIRERNFERTPSLAARRWKSSGRRPISAAFRWRGRSPGSLPQPTRIGMAFAQLRPGHRGSRGRPFDGAERYRDRSHADGDDHSRRVRIGCLVDAQLSRRRRAGRQSTRQSSTAPRAAPASARAPLLPRSSTWLEASDSATSCPSSTAA